MIWPFKKQSPALPVQSVVIRLETLTWDASDVMALRAFLHNETGKKLIQICGQRAFQEAMKEAQGDRTNPQAAGMDSMLRYIFNLGSDAQLRTTLSRDAGEQATITPDQEQRDLVLGEHRSF